MREGRRCLRRGKRGGRGDGASRPVENQRGGRGNSGESKGEDARERENADSRMRRQGKRNPEIVGGERGLGSGDAQQGGEVLARSGGDGGGTAEELQQGRAIVG